MTEPLVPRVMYDVERSVGYLLVDELERLKKRQFWCGHPFPEHPNKEIGGEYYYCPDCGLHRNVHCLIERSVQVAAESAALARVRALQQEWRLRAGRLAARPRTGSDAALYQECIAELDSALAGDVAGAAGE